MPHYFKTFDRDPYRELVYGDEILFNTSEYASLELTLLPLDNYYYIANNIIIKMFEEYVAIYTKDPLAAWTYLPRGDLIIFKVKERFAGSYNQTNGLFIKIDDVTSVFDDAIDNLPECYYKILNNHK